MRKKPKVADTVTRFMQAPMCPVQVACDGNTLIGANRIAKKMCLKCEERLARRNKSKEVLP